MINSVPPLFVSSIVFFNSGCALRSLICFANLNIFSKRIRHWASFSERDSILSKILEIRRKPAATKCTCPIPFMTSWATFFLLLEMEIYLSEHQDRRKNIHKNINNYKNLDSISITILRLHKNLDLVSIFILRFKRNLDLILIRGLIRTKAEIQSIPFERNSFSFEKPAEVVGKGLGICLLFLSHLLFLSFLSSFFF